jgi:hypothetical protein
MAREIAPLLERGALSRLTGTEPQCSRCLRLPLVGEVIYELRSGKQACSLCVARAASLEGEPVGAERVRHGERPLAVLRRAA